MSKRILSVLLAIVMMASLLTFFAAAPASAATKATVNVGGKTYSFYVGDSFTYNVSLTFPTRNLATAQVEVPVNFSVLSGYSASELTDNYSAVNNGLGTAECVRFGTPNSFGLTGYVANFAYPSGYNFKTERVMLSLPFKVASTGTISLDAKVREVYDTKLNAIVDNSYKVKNTKFVVNQYLSDIKAKLDPPSVTSISNVSGGIKLTWDKVSGAAKYRVFRKLSTASSWTKMLDTTNTSYTNTTVTSGNTYVYTVACVSSDGKELTSDYNTTGWKLRRLDAPTLKSVSNVSTGVKIQWNAVSGAKYYRVMRKASGDTKWSTMATTSETSYINKSAVSNTTYTYTVACVASDKTTLESYYDTTGKTIKFLSVPVVSVSYASSGVKISWAKITGASAYRVMRKKKGDSSWTTLGSTTSTSFTNKSVTNNTTYIYTVRCVSADNSKVESYYDTTGKSILYLNAPKLKSVTNLASGVKVQWEAVKGAASYQVMRKGPDDTSWKVMGTTTSTSYTNSSVKNNTKYTYTVRCVDSSKKAQSYYDTTGKSIKFYTPPTISSITSVSTGIKLSWNKIDGVSKYRVYAKSGSETDYTKVADTTSTSYTYKSAKSGTKYTFIVRCLDSSGNVISSYNTGKSLKYTG